MKVNVIQNKQIIIRDAMICCCRCCFWVVFFSPRVCVPRRCNFIVFDNYDKPWTSNLAYLSVTSDTM